MSDASNAMRSKKTNIQRRVFTFSVYPFNRVGKREMKRSAKYSGRDHENTGPVLAVKGDP